jgi:uncharacterized protein
MPARPGADRPERGVPEVAGPQVADPESAGEAPERLARLQRDFAAHIRDPDAHPAPGDVEDRRMAIYRRLFFNNVSSLLAGNFPVLRSLYSESGWAALVREFYSEHRCQTPLFPELAGEFLRYLQDVRGPRERDPAFMLELAHYEWVELALSLDERELDDVAANPGGDLLQGRPVLSPLAWALTYRYPVHRIRADFQPQQPPVEATHLLVYRDRVYHVKFLLLNEVTQRLLQLLQAEPRLSGAELLHRVALDIAHPDPRRVLEAGAGVLADLRARDVLLGTRADWAGATKS